MPFGYNSHMHDRTMDLAKLIAERRGETYNEQYRDRMSQRLYKMKLAEMVRREDGCGLLSVTTFNK